MLQSIKVLVLKEIKLEWRQRHALNGVLLYLVSTIFICYLSFNVKTNQLNPLTWNSLFWIILLFTSINAVAKSFIQENEGRFLYYYSILNPQTLILARILYNAGLMLLLSFLGLGIYMLVLGDFIKDHLLFLINLFVASIGFSSTLTLISAIASKANKNQTLMAILGFPIILPMLLMVIKVSKNAMDGLTWSSSYDELLVLLAINGIVVAVSLMLFPYLWRT